MAKKQKSENSDSTYNNIPYDVVSEKANSTTYVVVRDGFRVSDKEYNDVNDASALAEQEFWNKVSTKHSYGESVVIVQYDSKKHRVW